MLVRMMQLQVLLAALVNTWDKLRAAAVRCLLLLPCPLPGLAQAERVLPLVQWADVLISSPRQQESDAGVRAATLSAPTPLLLAQSSIAEALPSICNTSPGVH
jgi:hypothetical protein